MTQYQRQNDQYDDGIPESHDVHSTDGDLATYNTRQVGNTIHESGIISLIQNVSMSLFQQLQMTLQTFPIISFCLTWYFIIAIPLSVFSRWFLFYFPINILRPISFLQYLSFLIPVSIPMSVLSAATLAFHGSRIEEMRGSSYLLCFIIVITFLTYSTTTTLQFFLNIGEKSDPEIWLDRNIGFFDTLGWEFLPFTIVLLHGFLANHPYIAVMAVPLRIHMIPSLAGIAVLYGLTHWFRLPLVIFIAMGLTWAGKYIWLSKTYTKLTSLLFVPALSRIGPVERNLEWCYDAKLSDDEQTQQSEELWQLTAHLHRYVISLLTTEQFGEVVGTAKILQRNELTAQYSQLSFRPNSHRANYSSIPNTSLPVTSSTSSTSSLTLNSLRVNSPQNTSMNAPNTPFDPEDTLSNPQSPRSESNDSFGTLLHSSSDEGSSLLIDPQDQTCFDCNNNPTGQKCLNHLKFKSFVHKHTKSEFHPMHVQYYNFPVEPKNNTSQQV